MSHDVALLQLDCSVSFNQNISPILLPRSSDSLREGGTNVYVAGWGLTQGKQNFLLYNTCFYLESGSISSVALEATLTTVSSAECEKTYGTGDIDSTKMCAYGSGKDTCQGDSGGPLVNLNYKRSET
jgi:trypsin